ncbi:unnamed protein product [Caenorhabditis nigoni]
MYEPPWDEKFNLSKMELFSFHEKLAEQPNGPVTIEFKHHLPFDWSLTAIPAPGSCYELQLTAECAEKNAPENLKNLLEGNYYIYLYCLEGKSNYIYHSKNGRELPRFTGKLVPGTTTVARNIPKCDLVKAKIQMVLDVRNVFGYDGRRPESNVKLDIGGTKFVTTESTICKYFSRLKRDFGFHNLRSHVEAISCWPDKPQEYWHKYQGCENISYDRDSTNFRYILDFLRDGEDIELPKKQEKIEGIVKEAKFWMLKELEELCERRLIESKLPETPSQIDDDALKLDIGGTVFKTTVTTLKKFDGRFRTLLDRENTTKIDTLFIDRSPKHFDLILNFMRDGDVELPESSKEIREISREAKYYSFSGLVKICDSLLYGVDLP